jgi:hypothetical protein
MRTPAGFECRFFYADYYRGRNHQECRLVQRDPGSARWSPGLCRGCPVPKILAANACPHLVLDAKVVKTWGGLGRKVEASAACTKSLRDVDHPATGCGQCHEVLSQLTPPDHS